MIECFVNRKTKELLVALEFKNDIECKGACFNDEYDAVKFSDDVKLEAIVTERDGKTFLNFEYNKQEVRHGKEE